MHDGISEAQSNAPMCSITLHSVVTMRVILWWVWWTWLPEGCFRGESGKGIASPRAPMCLSALPFSHHYYFPTRCSLTCRVAAAWLWPTVMSLWEDLMARQWFNSHRPLPENDHLLSWSRKVSTAGVTQDWFPYWEGERGFLPSSFILGKYLHNKQIVSFLSCKHMRLYFIYI